MLQGVAGLVCRKKRSERRDGDGTAAAAGSAAVPSSAQSVPASGSDRRPAVHSTTDSSAAVDSSSPSSSVVADQSARQPVDAVTERLADLELSGGLRQRRRNGPGQDAAPSRDQHQHAGDRDARRH